MKIVIAAAALFLTSCSPKSDVCVIVGGDELKRLTIPVAFGAPGEVAVSVKIPGKFLCQSEGEKRESLRPLNYLTGQPVDKAGNDDRDVISIRMRPWPSGRGEDMDGFRFWSRFEEIGERRFGLSYRPMKVASRPPELWKRAYFKPDVSGRYFHITCIPPIAPGSIGAPKYCKMTLLLGAEKVARREWGGQVDVAFAEDRLSDWPEIEERVKNLFEPTMRVGLLK